MWFVLALIAGLLFAANKLIFRKVFVKDVHPVAFLAAHDTIAGLLLLPVALFNVSFPQSTKTWIALSLGVLLIFLANLFAALSLKYTEASLYQIVGQLRNIVTLIGGYLIFNEVITLSKVVAITLIVVGVIIAIKEKSRLQLNKGIVYAFISGVTIALAFLFIKQANVDVKPVFSAALSLIVSGILAYGLITLRSERPAKLVPSEHRLNLVVAATIFAVFEFVLFTALKLGEASKVTPVTQSSMIFTLIGGYLFLNERSKMKQKIIGSVLIVIGIGALYFA